MAANRRAEVDQAIADVDFDANTYQIEFETTAGRMLLDLYPDVAPGHCKNIIGLTKIGFYTGCSVDGSDVRSELGRFPILYLHGPSTTPRPAIHRLRKNGRRRKPQERFERR